MKKFQAIYDENKKLDAMFIERYNHDDLIRKNKLELLVELGELANETKCFKYWTNKKPVRELVGEEYADCLIMTLCFFGLYNLELDDNIHENDLDIIDMFGNLYLLASEFYFNEQEETIRKIYNLLINLGHKLEFNDDEIIEICLRKINIGKERLRESENS